MRGTDPQKGPSILHLGLLSSLKQICAKFIINLKTYTQAKRGQSHTAVGGRIRIHTQVCGTSEPGILSLDNCQNLYSLGNVGVSQ